VSSVRRGSKAFGVLGLAAAFGMLSGCGSGSSAVSSAPATPSGSFSGTTQEAQLLARGVIEKGHVIADVKAAAEEQEDVAAAGPTEKRRSVGSRSRLTGSFGSSFTNSSSFTTNTVRVLAPPVFVTSSAFIPFPGSSFNPVFNTIPLATPIIGLSPAFWSFNVAFGSSFLLRPTFGGSVTYTFVQPVTQLVASPVLPRDPISFAFNGVDIVLVDALTTINGGVVQVDGGLLSGFRIGFDRWRVDGEALVAGSSAVLTNAAGQQVSVLVQTASPTQATLRLTYGANTPIPGQVRIVTATRQTDGRIVYA
jgi:hypothetical protein